MKERNIKLDKLLDKLSRKGISAATIAKTIGIQPSKLSRIRAGFTRGSDGIIDDIIKAYPEIKEFAESLTEDIVQEDPAPYELKYAERLIEVQQQNKEYAVKIEQMKASKLQDGVEMSEYLLNLIEEIDKLEAEEVKFEDVKLRIKEIREKFLNK